MNKNKLTPISQEVYDKLCRVMHTHQLDEHECPDPEYLQVGWLTHLTLEQVKAAYDELEARGALSSGYVYVFRRGGLRDDND